MKNSAFDARLFLAEFVKSPVVWCRREDRKEDIIEFANEQTEKLELLREAIVEVLLEEKQ